MMPFIKFLAKSRRLASWNVKLLRLPLLLICVVVPSKDAFVILDEAQNTTIMQMKMFLTRLGFNSKMIVNGDMSQIDLPRRVKSGLVDAMEKLKGIKAIDFVHFSASDVVRHPVVADIINAYEKMHLSLILRKNQRDQTRLKK